MIKHLNDTSGHAWGFSVTNDAYVCNDCNGMVPRTAYAECVTGVRAWSSLAKCSAVTAPSPSPAPVKAPTSGVNTGAVATPQRCVSVVNVLGRHVTFYVGDTVLRCIMPGESLHRPDVCAATIREVHPASGELEFDVQTPFKYPANRFGHYVHLINDPTQVLRAKPAAVKWYSHQEMLNTFEAAAKCECGAHKASGIRRGAPGHSSWCPWTSKS